MKSLMRKILLYVFVLSLLAVPAHAEFSALERGTTAGRIIYSVSDDAYRTKNGQAITEEAISGLSSKDYGKTGLIADGNSRLILRYQSSQPGTVTFSISPSMTGSRLESLAARQEITAPLSTVSTSNGYQVSAVLIAPETWPENITYPSGNFTVTAAFTPSAGNTITETLDLTLKAPSIVLIHGAFGTNEKMFGYTEGSNTGVWHKLENAGLNVISWNYDSSQPPKTLIASNTNGLAQIISDTLNALNKDGFAATRVDLVTHSSGGLMARQYLRNDTDTGNKTANSYGLGTVRRVVMIASPNLGTPIGSYLSGNFSSLPSSWQNWQAKSFWEGTGYNLIKMLAANKSYSDEVMTDLSLGSSYIAGLGYPGIPFHSIYGKIKADESKINQLFDNVVNQNVVALKEINWLPERLVESLTSSKLGIISGVLTTMSDDIRFKELLGALYGNDDYDLVVSETSAKDKFPSNAFTSFEGLETHNHLVIAKQDDVGDKVLTLLRGGRENFSINTASTAEYDAAFDRAADSFAKYLRISENNDLSEYLDPSMLLDISDPQDEYMGGDEEPVIQSVKLSGNSSLSFSDDIYVILEDGEGAAKFFVMNPTDKNSFDVEIWADTENKGIYKISYFTVQNGKLKISPTGIIAYAPKFSSTITPNVYWSSEGNIYAHAGDEISAGLIVEAEGKNYDISAPVLGVVSYEISDSGVAEITDFGYIKALKEGETTITATAYGQTVSINFIVKQSTSEADTTNDIIISDSDENNGIPSSSGGCNTLPGTLIILSVMMLFAKKR
ncbi:MAG: hypothetical protein IJT21_03235 [Synergistaceae bacterium]|nr:hypothetical protein [Synergistaceae bacterium]